MIAVSYPGAGGPEVVSVGERPDPVPGDHEVLVRATHAGLNPADLAQRAGRYPAPPGSPQDIPGLELEARQPVRDGARPGQAIPLEVHAEEAELRHLLRELARQDALLEPFADLGDDSLAHPLPHRVADRFLLVVEQRVDGEKVAGIERGLLRRGSHTRIVEDGYFAGARLASASESHGPACFPHRACSWPPG